MIGAISPINTALSALTAQQISLGVTADNVANAETPGYAAEQTDFVAMNPGVIATPVLQSPDTQVDLTNQMINLITAKNAYTAAADVINTSDAMLKTALAIA